MKLAHRKGLSFALPAMVVWAMMTSHPANASIPDADIRAHVNQGGIGMISGVYGHADFGLSDREAIGAYVGTDPNDLYFNDYGPGDNEFDSNAIVGGHFMYQFVETEKNTPNVAGIFGAFADRAGVRPELGVALSYPFSERWTGRANVVYGPSWGFEAAYRFNQQVEGTIGVTGMGMLGIGFNF